MKIEDVKKMPKEFNFKSNINDLNIVYHAKENKWVYEVSCHDGRYKWYITKEDVYKHLLDGDYYITDM